MPLPVWNAFALSQPPNSALASTAQGQPAPHPPLPGTLACAHRSPRALLLASRGAEARMQRPAAAGPQASPAAGPPTPV